MSQFDQPLPGTQEALADPAVSVEFGRRQKQRQLQDRLARRAIATGGITIILAVAAIFFYLAWEVLPLFRGADISQRQQYVLEQAIESESLLLVMAERADSAMRLSASGELLFFHPGTGDLQDRMQLSLPAGAVIQSVARDDSTEALLALGLSTGEVMIISYAWESPPALDSAERVPEPIIEWPFGQLRWRLAETGITSLALRASRDGLSLAAVGAAGEITLLELEAAGPAAILPREVLSVATRRAYQQSLRQDLGDALGAASRLFIDHDRRWLIAQHGAELRYLDLDALRRGNPDLILSTATLLPNGSEVTDIQLLTGERSLLVADGQGQVHQWSFVPAADSQELKKIRVFSVSDGSLSHIATEPRRKNYAALDRAGNLALLNTTAERRLLDAHIDSSGFHRMAVSPRGDGLLLESAAGRFDFLEIINEHSEIGWAALWSKVWYEGYAEPDLVWQSTSAGNDFEPKYSLAPLGFGTLKAAFYAMLLAAPLAVCAAIYTGYFMAQPLRGKVKPLIEMMEAMPTVVLGFLAGLWLAPFVENNLLGVFSLLLLLPLGVLMVSFGWFILPAPYRHWVPPGWEAMLLLPVLVLLFWASLQLAAPLETWFFGGDLRQWLSREYGIGYDQRNALVVGFAMGFAIIPTIYSIAEDAIFTVPRHLSDGSLALGASSWQSLYHVVLPTASPGIFSALMIGFGRAIGETMIVLMATGNTPIMDINIFEGMRTLAANIAVEVPESEVGSTHFRILFLTAFLLFILTFVLNTMAELVRQRLRRRYSNI